jgi:hypothetical protein
MGTVLRGVGLLLAGIVLLAVVLGTAARFSDGPIGPFPGGPFSRGELATGPEPDWSFARDLRTIELQTLEPPRSRTTWILVMDGTLYVPCAFARPKQWPDHVEQDARVVLRIEGTLYERQAVRVTDPELLRRLGAESGHKYGERVTTREDFERFWFFRMDPRPAA